MAYSNEATAPNQRKADGFLNLTVKAKDGSDIKLRRGIALDLNNRVERSLLNAAEAQGEDFSITLTGTIHRVEAESAEDIQF